VGQFYRWTETSPGSFAFSGRSFELDFPVPEISCKLVSTLDVRKQVSLSFGEFREGLAAFFFAIAHVPSEKG
jgi:hypothetical protein